MKPAQTLAMAQTAAKAIVAKACVHPNPELRRLELAAGILRLSAPRFDELLGALFAPPPIAQLTPKPPAQELRELVELHQHGAAMVGAILVALDQLAPLPPPGALRGVNGSGKR